MLRQYYLNSAYSCENNVYYRRYNVKHCGDDNTYC